MRPELGSSTLFVNSGELQVVSTGTLTAVLGSCVAIVVFDQRQRLAGMNHYLLPYRGSASEQSHLTDLHFGESSILELLRQFKHRGSRPTDLRVGVFGGASGVSSRNSNSPGEENVRVAMSILRKFGLEPETKETGGDRGRRVYMDVVTGRMQSELLKRSAGERKTRVLIVDDSGPMRMILRKIFALDGSLEVVGDVGGAAEADKFLEEHEIDVVSLDVQMPKTDGVEFFQKTLKGRKIPALLVSDLSPATSNRILDGLALGCFDYFQKPSLTDLQILGPQLCEKVRMAAISHGVGMESSSAIATGAVAFPRMTERPSCILIGASTGGTDALARLFSGLPSHLPPILIVQHMPVSFTSAFAERLNRAGGIRVTEAKDGQIVLPGQAVVAPGGRHMGVKIRFGEVKTEISDGEAVNRFKPSVDHLFLAAAKSDAAPGLMACLLTGMGADGAAGLKALRDKGAMTITQAAKDCLVYGMPKAADDLGASRSSLTIAELNEFFRLIKRHQAVS